MVVKRNYEILKDMSLPKWLSDQLPEPLPCSYISFEDGYFFVSHDWSRFSTIMEAYEYAVRFRTDFQIVFDTSVDGHGGNLDGEQFYADRIHVETQKPYKFLLSALNTDDSLFNLKYSYFVWLTQYSLAYIEDPDDFYHAYNFLTHHPVFWIKSMEEKSYHWSTSKGLQLARVTVSHTRNRDLIVSLHHGRHRAPEYTSYHLDSTLYVYDESYEKAVVALAQKVHERFDLDGYARPNG